MKDYYETLGVGKSATGDEIKRAYRKLALQYHPDRNKTKEADVKFKEINHAYEILSDSQKRQKYDQFGAQAFEGGGQGPGGTAGGPFGGARTGRYGPFTYTYSTSGDGADFDSSGFSDPFDIFEQFFGGSPFASRQRRPVYSLNISFMDAVNGAEKEVMLDGKKQMIKIPAGVDNGSRIRFESYDVLLDVESDKRFHREGADIVTEQKISFTDAILGTEISVETIEGPVKIRIPQGTQPDTLIRLSGKGVPYVRDNGRGDHYVKIKVHIQKNISRRQRELLKEFENEGKRRKSWL